MIVAQTEAALHELMRAMEGADRIGLDVEGNGLHAYRAELCVVQVGWRRGDGEIEVGIIDPFAVDIDLFAELFSERGPVKVLHDLTFDARLLGEHDVQLGNVHDTSVMAQLLGEPKSGLASLVEKHFGVHLSKSLQNHDWAARPFTPKQLDYLCQDVRFLHDLDDILRRDVAAAQIEDEVATECAYKLQTAFDPPRDQRPPHERVKGFKTLGMRTKCVLKRICDAREAIAELEDEPPFRIAPNGLLLELARRTPKDEAAIERFFRRKPAARHAERWLRAIELGKADEALPPPPPPPSAPLMTAAEQALQKRLQRKLTDWRKKEAARREVTLQVVIPGHCMSEVTEAIAAHRGDVDATLEALTAIAGLGDERIDRYLATWTSLAS